MCVDAEIGIGLNEYIHDAGMGCSFACQATSLAESTKASFDLWQGYEDKRLSAHQLHCTSSPDLGSWINLDSCSYGSRCFWAARSFEQNGPALDRAAN